MLPTKRSTTRRAIDGGEKLAASSGGRDTRGAIMRRELSATLERDTEKRRKKRKKKETLPETGRMRGANIGLKARRTYVR